MQAQEEDRRTRGVCVRVEEKVKRRRIGKRLPHVHEKFKLSLANQEEEMRNALVISLRGQVTIK